MRAPRASACSRSSSTSIPAPSPMTNPSRVRSNGREAPGGVAGVVVERADLDVAGDDQRRQRRVGAARHDHVGAALADHRQAGADGVGAGRAGGRRRARGPAQAERPRRRRAGVVGQRGGDGERPHAVGAALEQGAVGLQQGLRAAVDAADRDADALGRGVRVARVLERQGRRDGGQPSRAIHAPRVALAEALAGVLARDARRRGSRRRPPPRGRPRPTGSRPGRPRMPRPRRRAG